MYILTVVLTIILLLFSTIYFYFKKCFEFFEQEGIPHVKPSFPLGNCQGMGNEYHMVDMLINIYNKLKGKGPLIGFYSLNEPIYLITDIELIKTVMIKDFSNFVNRGFFVNEENEPLTGNLLNAEDDRWKFMRNKLSPAFTSGKLKSMFFTISDVGKKLVDAIETGKSVEVKNITTRFSTDVISSVSFGMESNTLKGDNPELIEFVKEVFGAEGPGLIYLFFISAFPNFAKFMKFRVFSKKLEDFFVKVVGGNIERREKSKEIRNDFLNMLIQLKEKGSIEGEFSSETKKLTMTDCLAQSFIFFFGGNDTTSSTISYALVELSRNPDIQDKLRQQIHEKTKDTNGEITYEALNEMTYLNQVVNETLRLYTPGFVAFRIAKEDFKVPNTKLVIKKGHKVWLPTLAMHYDERYWQNPHKFDPERFTQEEIAKRPAQCFLPFGEGPRNCIGMRFGLVNVKFAIATIIKNFSVYKDARMKYPIKFNPARLSMEPIGGFWVKFEKI